MNYKEIKQQRFEEVKKGIDDKILQGYLPNIKSMENMVRKLNRRAKKLQDGAQLFAIDLEEVEKVESALARINGEIAAYKVYIDKYYKLKEQ